MKRSIKLTLILVLLLAGCKQKAEQKTVEKKAIAVKTTKVIKKDFSPKIGLSGTFYAYKEANLGTALPGKVEKIFFPKGSRVKKGDLLVQLSDELLIQAEIENNAIKTDFEKVRRLKEKGSVTIQDYDHLKAKLDASEAKIKMLKKNTSITAPFSGIIVDYLVQEGENYLFSPNLKAGYSFTSGIVCLMQTDKLILKAGINEKELAKIKKGMKAEVTTDACPGKNYIGTVSFINPALDMLTHSATIEILIDNSRNNLKPGMFAKASIELPASEALFAPRQSVVQQQGTNDNFVMLAKNNKAIKKEITLIQIIGEEAIIEGIPEGTEIISTGKNKVRDGSELAIKN